MLVFSIRSWFLLFVIRALLERVCHEVFGFPVFPLPILTPNNDAVCGHLRWSICATWPHHFHLRLWATCTMPFMFVLCLISAFVTLPLHTTVLYIYIHTHIHTYICVCVCIYIYHNKMTSYLAVSYRLIRCLGGTERNWMYRSAH